MMAHHFLKVIDLARDSKGNQSLLEKAWDNKSVAKCWKRKYLYSEGEKDMKSHNYCTHFQMSGHWIRKCWKLHPELRGTPSKNARTRVYAVGGLILLS
jgi:hypothetical protein